MAILSKLQDNEALIIDELSVTEVKTKPMAQVLEALKLADTTCLIGTASPPRVILHEADAQQLAAADEARENHTKLYRSVRNIAGVEIMPASQFNAYTVLRQKRLVLTRAALEELRQVSQLTTQTPSAGPQE